MNICEIFTAIQGEGLETGTPTIFVRCSGCNLIREKKSCSWCDSLFAEKESKKMSIKEIVKEVNKYKLKHITITGGEPLLQKEDLSKLMREFPNHHISLETNGTINFNNLPFDTIVVSPKKQKIDMKILTYYSHLDNVYFKFVFDKDLWFEKIIKELKLPQHRVYIMPEGKEKKQQEDKMGDVMEYCLKKDYMFSPRLHVLAFGNKRRK